MEKPQGDGQTDLFRLKFYLIKQRIINISMLLSYSDIVSLLSAQLLQLLEKVNVLLKIYDTLGNTKFLRLLHFIQKKFY